jgi:23S rRNA (adenine2503-C2)-methyltransferase
MSTNKINLLGLDQQGLLAFFKGIDESPFRARQLLQWIHQRGVVDFESMTDISKNLRSKLHEIAEIKTPTVILRKPSQDGTQKWLMQMPDGNAIETVYIPEDDRGTLCISSQVGCILTCKFCSTGTQGFNRNLSTAEIIGQLWVAVRELSTHQGQHDRHITNVVMMGMGEPLLNFENVIPSLHLMLDDYAYGLSKRKVTVSTSGIVPQIYELKKAAPVSLAISLHAPNDKLRSEIMPINKKYTIQELIKACKDYVGHDPHKNITFEYVMLQEVNDHVEQAHELINLVKGLPCKFNLIPFNPFPGTNFTRSSNNRIHQFKKILEANGLVTTIRKTRGDDIDAACGQLVGQVQDRTSRQQKLKSELTGLKS